MPQDDEDGSHDDSQEVQEETNKLGSGDDSDSDFRLPNQIIRPSTTNNTDNTDNAKNTNNTNRSTQGAADNLASTNPDKSNSNDKQVFRSRFPGLELDSFENHLDEWTTVGLREAIAKQGATNSRPHSDIRALAKSIRLEYEKRMLMAALMGAIPEAVVWNIVYGILLETSPKTICISNHISMCS